MGKLYEFNDQISEIRTEDYTIRVPLKMVQITEKDGRVRPLAFFWKNGAGAEIRVEISKVIAITPSAQRKSGAVGDCYICDVQGRIEHLYYGKLHPRKWFLIQNVSKEEYDAYYKLPGEITGLNGRGQ